MIDEAFEIKVLACLLRLNEFCAVASQHIKPSYFSDTVRHNLAKVGLDFYSRYQTAVTPHAIVHKIKELRKGKTIKDDDVALYVKRYGELRSMDISDWKFILEELVKFIKNKLCDFTLWLPIARAAKN